MPHLHMTPSVAEVRSYDEPNGYARRIPYRAVVTVTYLSDTHVYLHAAKGELARGDFGELLAMLKGKGVITVQLERHGRMKTITL